MKTLFVICVMLFSGCATITPTREIQNTDLEKIPGYSSDIQSIEMSLITPANKIRAKKLISQHYLYQDNLIVYGKSLRSVVNKNSRINEHYAVLNAIVATLGGISAAASTPAYAFASAGWNVVGLTVKTINIKPEIDKGTSSIDDLNKLNLNFSSPRSSFRVFTSAENSETAHEQFLKWENEETDLQDQVAKFFGIPAAGK